MLRVFRYAYGGAKVMALKSRLLTPEDYHFLLRVRTLDDFLGYLTATAYAPALAGWDWHRPDAEAEFSRRVYAELAQAFLKVGRGLPSRERSFIAILAQRLVAENLKVVLRALHQGLPQAQAVQFLLPVSLLTPLNFPELLNQGTVPALVKRLASTPWGPPLERGLPRYRREASLFPLEMSLDLNVFSSLWQGLAHLSAPDRRIAAGLLGGLTDLTNIIWTGRFREVYGFPGEEIYQYLIAAGSFRTMARRRALAFAGGLEEMVAALADLPYGPLLAGAANLADAEARLMRYWLQKLARVLAQPPFQIGLPITFLFLKELEIGNLLTLMTGLLLKVPPERLAPLLQGWAPGGGHV
jgi:V/A-type H+-transporting ATPase subunit C